jgi:hypothetical protein
LLYNAAVKRIAGKEADSLVAPEVLLNGIKLHLE